MEKYSMSEFFNKHYLTFFLYIFALIYSNPICSKSLNSLAFSSQTIAISICEKGNYVIPTGSFGIKEGANDDLKKGYYVIVFEVTGNFELNPNSGFLETSGNDITESGIIVTSKQITLFFRVESETNKNNILINNVGIKATGNNNDTGNIRIGAWTTALNGFTLGGLPDFVALTTTANNNGSFNNSAPTVDGVDGDGIVSVCIGGDATLKVSGGGGGLTYQSNDQYEWYLDASFTNRVFSINGNDNAPVNVSIKNDLNIDVSSPKNIDVFVVKRATTTSNTGICVGNNFKKITIKIVSSPTIILTKNVNKGCKGGVVTFTAIGPEGNYHFVTTGGATNPSEQNSNSKIYSPTFAETGDYTVNVTYSGCGSGSSSIMVTIIDGPVVFFITPGGSSSVNSITLPKNTTVYLRNYVNKPGGVFTGGGGLTIDGDKVLTSSLDPTKTYTLLYKYMDPETGCGKTIGPINVSLSDTPDFAFNTSNLNKKYCTSDNSTNPISIDLDVSFKPRYKIGNITSIKLSQPDAFNETTRIFDPRKVVIPEGQFKVNLTLEFNLIIFYDSSDPIPNPPNYNISFPYQHTITITVVKQPTGRIEVVSGFCATTDVLNPPQFKAIADQPSSSFNWDFGDGEMNAITLNSDNTTSFVTKSKNYLEAKEYTVTLIIKSDGCDSKPITQKIQVMPYYNNITASNPIYIKNEEWKEQGKNSTWGLGVPSSKRNIIPKVADKAIWTTMLKDSLVLGIGSNGDTIKIGSYPNNQLSSVECPCISLNQLDRPVLSMNIWSDSDRGVDGATLQVTYSDGENWYTIGNIGEGIEWYDAKDILGLPTLGNTNNIGSRQGWTGRDKTWRTARFALDDIKKIAKDSISSGRIRFRVFFGSNADNPPGKYDGFAFDSVRIESRNRQSIIEYFTANNAAFVSENDIVRVFPDDKSNESTRIQYQTNFSNTNSNLLYEDNKADPSARALYYGISKAPRAAIDGFSRPDSLFSQWGKSEFVKKTLIPAPFNITIEAVVASDPSNQLNIKAKVKALQNFNRPIIIHTLVLETSIDKTKFSPPLADNGFNVVKKMLPNAAGVYFDSTWTTNQERAFGQSILLYQLENSNALNPKIYDKSKLAVLVFIQDDKTKEVYQSSLISPISNLANLQLLTGIEDPLLSKLRMFPNPTQQEVNFELEQALNTDYQWEIYNYWGAKVASGKFAEDLPRTTVKVSHLAQGMYLVKISNRRTRASVSQKLIIR